MKNNFTQNLFIGILLATFVSFLLTKNIDLFLSFLWILIYILIFCGFIYIDIIIHEFGHAIAGWIVKFPIKIITILKSHISLDRAINEATNPALAFLYLAYACYLKGNRQQSQKYWQKINNNEDLKSSEYRLLFGHIFDKTNYFTMP
ncbi:hypothetical protein NIES25_45640 [Nostoc linckia NIES-25]|nr:hypothetical protein NIES25_45640 [Nostoc linckia NIES-25]